MTTDRAMTGPESEASVRLADAVPLRRRAWLVTEFVALFVAVPLLCYVYRPPRPILVVLWAAAALCLFLLLRDPGFDRHRLWNAERLWRRLWPRLLRFAPIAFAIGLAVAFFEPERLFDFPREATATWALLLLGYPLFSVYPQGIVYRAFFFRRYEALFGKRWGMVLVATGSFALSHIVFGNWVAVALTAIGGLIFAETYRRTGSLLVAGLEHAAYGCFVFTIGLGRYIYYAG